MRNTPSPAACSCFHACPIPSKFGLIVFVREVNTTRERTENKDRERERERPIPRIRLIVVKNKQASSTITTTVEKCSDGDVDLFVCERFLSVFLLLLFVRCILRFNHGRCKTVHLRHDLELCANRYMYILDKLSAVSFFLWSHGVPYFFLFCLW